MPKKKCKHFSYHLSIQDKKEIIAICDNMVTATQDQKAEAASRSLGRPVSRITIRNLTKVRREKLEKCNSQNISNKVRVLDLAQQDFEKELSNKQNTIFRTTNIFYDSPLKSQFFLNLTECNITAQGVGGIAGKLFPKKCNISVQM